MPTDSSTLLLPLAVDQWTRDDWPKRWLKDQSRCPKTDHDRFSWLNTRTGEIRNAQCSTVDCPHCGVAAAHRRVQAVADGGTTGSFRHAWTLHEAPLSWRKTKQKMTDLPRLLARKGCNGWQHAYVLERNRQGLHVHLAAKGSQPSIDRMRSVWGSSVDHRLTRDYPLGAVGWADYMAKGCHTFDGLQDHLDLNQRRVVHNTRRFFGDLTLRETMSSLAPHDDDWVLRSSSGC